MPSQRKVWCGKLLVRDQEIFCVSRYVEPAALMICGSPAAKPRCPAARPRRSRRRTRRGRTASRARTAGPWPRSRACWCRTPPTCRRGTNRPSATAFFTRAHTSGRCSFTHAHCWACDMAKTKSGSSSRRAVMLAAVRATLRTVSRSGHSQAESMCACPTALMRCADGAAGAASTSVRRERARSAVPLTSWRSSASRARSTARRISQRRGESTGSSAISSPSTSRSVTRCHTVSSRTARSMRVRVYCGSLPAVARSPSEVGRKGR